MVHIILVNIANNADCSIRWPERSAVVVECGTAGVRCHFSRGVKQFFLCVKKRYFSKIITVKNNCFKHHKWSKGGRQLPLLIPLTVDVLEHRCSLVTRRLPIKSWKKNRYRTREISPFPLFYAWTTVQVPRKLLTRKRIRRRTIALPFVPISSLSNCLRPFSPFFFFFSSSRLSESLPGGEK